MKRVFVLGFLALMQLPAQEAKLYLSLSDAIEMALKNNLDIDLQRENLRIAKTDTLRARAGATLRGVSLAVREGPNGLGSPIPGQAGRAGGSDVPALDRLTGPGTLTDLSILGSVPLATGVAPVNRDIDWNSSIGVDHRSVPQASPFFAGADATNSNSANFSTNIAQGFSTGARLAASFDLGRLSNNNPWQSYNPYLSSTLALSLTQPLLRGFGRTVNNRYIRIAKNNEAVADHVFEQQVIVTISAVVRLYWDLESLRQDIQVREEALKSSQRLLEDTQASLEVGKSASIDVTRARAELSRRERDLNVARSLVRQQELVLLDYLTHDKQRATEVITTDHAKVETPDLKDYSDTAIEERPDLRQARLQIENAGISLKGSKNALLPSVDLVARVANNGLGGDLNGNGGELTPNGTPRMVNPIFLDGLGSALGQVFRRNYPDYGVAVNVSVPIRNRAAKADVERDQFTVRQSEIRLRQLEKQVRLEIANAQIALEQARASYESAQAEEQFEKQAVDAEFEKLEAGATTQASVIQLQRDLAQARSASVTALNGYMKAKLSFDRATGQVLRNHNVNIASIR
ncbi:TolC family protein [Bryobacter aggregatus]|uniref:TolC family protein n=1 Tax=Bryobacter aggregatus TaxID=360054 RepID=UPI0004E0F242|nr:TolC family protein [Bryobacter aggregatus]